jgi:hypothetical protein
MTAAPAIRREHLVARFDSTGAALLDELVPLRYSLDVHEGLPRHVRAASALRRFENRLVIVQDDVNALAIRSSDGVIDAVLLPAHPSGRRAFDETLGNKHDKLDLEACVTLPDGRLVAFGSGSAPNREQVVVWSGGQRSPSVVAAGAFYAGLRAAVTQGAGRLNVEGAVVRGARLELFHRGNDERIRGSAPTNAIAAVACDELAALLDGHVEHVDVSLVTTVELGDIRGVPFGFTDAVALDDERVLVLACAEDSACAISDGAVLGCRIGLLAGGGLRMVDVYEPAGERTLLKLEGIERRSGSSSEFDVVADVDRPGTPAQLGRLVWEPH